MLDNFAVVVQSKSFYIYRFIKRPSIRGVFLGKHFTDDAGAVEQLLRNLGAAVCLNGLDNDWGMQNRRCRKLRVWNLRLLCWPRLATTLPFW